MHQAIVACEKEAAIGVNEIDSSIKICNMERLSSRSKYIDSTIKHGYYFIQLKKSRTNYSFKSDIEHLNSRGEYINETIQKEQPFIQLKKSRDDEFFKNDIQKLKRHNIRINYVQADSKEEVSKLLEYGIDFILTDRLADMLEAFSEVKQSQLIN